MLNYARPHARRLPGDYSVVKSVSVVA